MHEQDYITLKYLISNRVSIAYLLGLRNSLLGYMFLLLYPQDRVCGHLAFQSVARTPMRPYKSSCLWQKEGRHLQDGVARRDIILT